MCSVSSGFLQGRGLSEAEARRLLQQLLVALQHVHDKGIANRDIKVRVGFDALWTASWFCIQQNAVERLLQRCDSVQF